MRLWISCRVNRRKACVMRKVFLKMPTFWIVLQGDQVGKTSMDDCIHIAVATLSEVDILVSWNFKHIVNVCRIRGYNSVNLRLGYSTLEIRSPREIAGI